MSNCKCGGSCGCNKPKLASNVITQSSSSIPTADELLRPVLQKLEDNLDFDSQCTFQVVDTGLRLEDFIIDLAESDSEIVLNEYDRYELITRVLQPTSSSQITLVSSASLDDGFNSFSNSQIALNSVAVLSQEANEESDSQIQLVSNTDVVVS